jgi:hypothetical protein
MPELQQKINDLGIGKLVFSKRAKLRKRNPRLHSSATSARKKGTPWILAGSSKVRNTTWSGKE